MGQLVLSIPAREHSRGQVQRCRACVHMCTHVCACMCMHMCVRALCVHV